MVWSTKPASFVFEASPDLVVAKCLQIDGTREDVLMSRFEIRGFPSFFHLAKGECREYDGERTVDEVGLQPLWASKNVTVSV